MNRLQVSSFSFLPAVIASVAGASAGAQLRFAHIFVASMFFISFVNHSRDYYEGPHLDLIDLTDRVVVATLTLACLLDGFALETWQIVTATTFALTTLGLFLYSLTLKNVVMKGAVEQTPRKLDHVVDPEIVHAYMHACAGIAVFLVLV
jgi:small-conductance mechanosensitive channel